MCVFLSDVQQIAIKRFSSELAHDYDTMAWHTYCV